MRAGELAAASGVTGGALSALLRRLTEAGELEKRELPGGQTGYALRAETPDVTPAGPATQAAPTDSRPEATQAQVSPADGGPEATQADESRAEPTADDSASPEAKPETGT